MKSFVLFLSAFLVIFSIETKAASCVCGLTNETFFDSKKYNECVKDTPTNSDSDEYPLDCSSPNQDPVSVTLCEAREAISQAEEAIERTCRVLAESTMSKLIFVKDGQKITLEKFASRDECRKAISKTPECN